MERNTEILRILKKNLLDLLIVWTLGDKMEDRERRRIRDIFKVFSLNN